ncbi:MAG: hypothetical protein QM296_03580 [Bacillota bacterium]|nr:hypothetical protein [Bacillota bacterium]
MNKADPATITVLTQSSTKTCKDLKNSIIRLGSKHMDLMGEHMKTKVCRFAPNNLNLVNTSMQSNAYSEHLTIIKQAVLQVANRNESPHAAIRQASQLLLN